MGNTEQDRYLLSCVDRHVNLIYEAERYIWKHPETGFKEWETMNYLRTIFEQLGYSVVLAGDIPGFYADIDTGKPGPKVLVMGEMDALLCEGHPEAVNGVVHACGHHAQCAGLVGLAAALKEPGAIDNLCGSIRLMAVPAEEMIEISFREELRKQGLIRFLGGKAEFVRRGHMNDVDMAMLIHTRNLGNNMDFFARGGSNGFTIKELTFLGRAAHAGSAPEEGINALYAANLGLNAVNGLRETFREDQKIRVHSIITDGGKAVNVIPDSVKVEMLVRSASHETIDIISRKVDRAMAGAAVSMGTNLEIKNIPGYMPLVNCKPFMKAFQECAEKITKKQRINIDETNWSTGSTDMGDLCGIMPTIQPYAGGAIGSGHGTNYYIEDVNRACVNSAKVELLLLNKLLNDNALIAKEIIHNFSPIFTRETFITHMENAFSRDSVIDYSGSCNSVIIHL